MEAIRTTKANFTYLGPAPEVADLPGGELRLPGQKEPLNG